MQGYLGTVVINKATHPDFKELTASDFALMFITMYGGFLGASQKDWVLDQVARILNGVEVIIEEASWDNGQTEFRYTTSDVLTDDYNAFVANCRGEWSEEHQEWEYSYEFGIAP
jgi:hypothetical protein